MKDVIGIMKCKSAYFADFKVRSMKSVNENDKERIGWVGIKDSGDEYHVYCKYWDFEPVTSADVEVVKYDPTKVDDFASDATINKYTRDCKGVQVDVYDVLQAFGVTNPALQHLIKKALCVGIRGHKTKQQDLQDIIDSAIRAKELEQ